MKTKKTYAYKVLAIAADARFSLFAKGKKYKLSYPKHKKVYAPKNTLGIMVFETCSAANAFAYCCNLPQTNAPKEKVLVVKVQCHGKKKIPEFISRTTYKSCLDLYYTHRMNVKHLFDNGRPPKRTVCYPAVTCLE